MSYTNIDAGEDGGTSGSTSDDNLTARIEYAVSKIGKDKSAKAMGKDSRSVSRYLAGTSEPPFTAIVRLAQAALVHINWLATGEGPRDSSHVMGQTLKGTQREQSGGAMLQTLDQQQLQAGDFVLLPRLEVQASAGQGIFNPEEEVRDFVAFDRAYLRSAGINPALADVIQVNGRSMMPSLVDGEWVVVDRSNVRVIDDAIYAVVVSDEVLVKRLRRDGSAIILISDNKAEGYGDKRFEGASLEELRIVGRVRRHIRSL